jgi:phosphatidylinositol alpha-1,6-mannosyltransferase
MSGPPGSPDREPAARGEATYPGFGEVASFLFGRDGRIGAVPRTLIVTNDFPPRQGGIQSFVHAMALRLPPEELVVYASTYPGAAEFDAQQPFPVVRHPTGLLIPTPAARRRIVATARQYHVTSVWFGAAAPLALLAPALRRVGVRTLVATTHGHEVGWARLPLARQALHRIGSTCDVVTYLGEYTRRRLVGALGPLATMRQLSPGVDVETFHDGIDGQLIRDRYGLGTRPVIVCVSRLVHRKGQDTLIRAHPAIRERVPGTALLIVGRGPLLPTLRRLALEAGVNDDVIFTEGVPTAELPAHFAAGDVFAMPCRTRRFGLDVEGLGIVYLEASAMGLPVIAGDSGGAPDAVLEGETGYVVPGRDPQRLVERAVELLSDPDRRRRLGRNGQRWVGEQWRWELIAQRLADLLVGER